MGGQFSMELFRAFSSMNNGKGLPEQKRVKEVLSWPEWRVVGQFSMELFRAFSSMKHSKGLPEHKRVKEVLSWPEWHVDGQFSMERLRAFSSMNNGKGLPEQERVKEVLSWPEWQGVDGQVQYKTVARLFVHESWQRLAQTSAGERGAGLAGKKWTSAMSCFKRL